MRAAHILRKYVPAEWGGTETAVQGLTSGLAAHGVTSVVFHPMAGGLTSDPLAACGCEMRPFRAHLPILGLSSSARREMLAVGGNLLSFDLPGMLAREPGLTVINSHVLGRLGGIACTVARRRNIPFVVTIHGGVLAVPEELRRKFNERPQRNCIEWGQVFGWWWRARHVLAEADAIVTCNAREAEMLRERHPGQLIVTQSHGINTEFYRTDRQAEALAAFPEIAGRNVLLCVARIDPVKNQLWLVQQLPSILARHPGTMLVLAGSCTNEEYGGKLAREIRQLGLTGHVRLTGGLPPRDPRLIGLMQMARAGILPSISETFGLVIIESWAAGLPMLVSRSAGSVELIHDGQDACLFNLADPGDFHAQLDRLLLEPAYRERLVSAAHLRADQFDTTTLAGRMQQLYAQLSEEKHALRHSA